MGDLVDDLSAEDLALLVMELPTLHMPTMTVPKATDFVHSGKTYNFAEITQVEFIIPKAVLQDCLFRRKFTWL